MKTLVQINPNKKNSLIGSFRNKLSSIAILDPTILDSHYLIQGIKPDTASYILENKTDAIEQITTFLAQHTGIESLHIITHGSPGKIYLGTTELNSSNIENYSQQFQQWRRALSANASIILYGCSASATSTATGNLT